MTQIVSVTRPIIEAGGQVFTDLANHVTLFAGVNTGNWFATAIEGKGTAGFQVPTGKTLTIKAFVFISVVSSVDQAIKFGYGDNDIGRSSATEPTNSVFAHGLTNTTGTSVNEWLAFIKANDLKLEKRIGGINFEVPADKYFFMMGSGNSSQAYFYGTLS